MYELTIQSPIHISTGTQLDPLRARQNNNELEIYSMDNVLSSISHTTNVYSKVQNQLKTMNNKREKKWLTLSDLIDEKTWSIQPIERWKVEANALHKSLLYEDIQETYQNIQGYYIPGSSLKGLLKTAFIRFLYKEFNNPMETDENQIETDEKNLLDSYLRNNLPLLKEIGQTFMTEDIQFKDANVRVMKQEIFTRKKGVQEGTPIIVISLISGTSKSFSITPQANVNFLSTASTLKNLRDISDYITESGTVLEQLYNYSYAIIERHLHYFDNLIIRSDNEKIVRDVQQFLKQMKEINTPQQPIIIIGKGTSMLSKTIVPTIKNKQLLEKYKSNIITGQKKVKDALMEGSIHDYPTSRVITKINNKYVMPGFATLRGIE